MDHRIIYLNNDKSVKSSFDRQRNVAGGKSRHEVVEENETEVPKTIREFQKERLRVNRVNFYSRRKRRNDKRTIEIPQNIDLIKVQFFTVFNADLNRKFLVQYGISPTEYFDFNKTVLFEIQDAALFATFLDHILKVVESPKNSSYHNKEYNLIALVYRFEFYGSRSRIMTVNGKGILLTLIDTSLQRIYRTQKERLFELLEERELDYSYQSNTPGIIEIKAADRQTIKDIADNFDIVKTITASRTEKIRPGYTGPIREYGFTVEIPDNLTTVGIIDTGISKIDPLKELILDECVNHTVHPDFWDETGHGTLVSGLVALGEDFYISPSGVHHAKAKLFNIKAIHFGNDDLDIPKLIKDIRRARRKFGIKLFNMSLVLPNAKRYNASYSQFAYELDKLAHEEDLLLFLAVGNFDSDNLQAILEDEYPDHEYPFFFYSLNSESMSHRCEDTNICVPSESLNNVSVGALAGNFDDTDNSDVTPVNFYPAYYTRKFHHDYSQQINKSDIKQKNQHLNKPDFVMEGGDLFEDKAGLQILRSPLADGSRFYGSTCGTSLATPLVTSYAAEILNAYPNMRTQSVKALLINSAWYYDQNKLEDFKEHSPNLLKSLVGFGRPAKGQLLGTDKDSIQYLIEDSIRVGEIMKIPIFLPDYMLANQNKLHFDVAMAYSFSPVKDNHLDYLPLYIAFNVVKNVSIKEISGKQNGYGIKNTFNWSEDHFGIDNRLFSNAQRRSYRLQPKDIVSSDGSVALAVRCLAKNNYVQDLSETEHQFSITVRITELISNINEGGINLYDEMMRINNYLPISAELEDDLEALL